MRYRFLLRTVVCYVLLAMGLCFWAWYVGALPATMWPLLLILGAVGWTLIEYLLHRFILHMHAPTRTIQDAVDKLHLGHHWEPADEAKITVPVYGSLPIALALLGLFRLVAGSWEGAALVMTGTIAGYLYYEVVHFEIHRGSTPKHWRRWQRVNHCFHHFRDPSRCFGVTTPLWDWAFGTFRGKAS